MLRTKKTIVSILVSMAMISGCNDSDSDTISTSPIPYFAEWTDVDSAIKKDDAMEAEIQRILALMTLEEKGGANDSARPSRSHS